MPRAKTKAELINTAEKNFSKLWETIDAMSEKALAKEFDFSNDVKKKELHWHRDKNLRDVFTHLYEWHQLLIRWVNANMAGDNKPFLPAPYNWKTYGQMNMEIWKKHQKTTLLDAEKMLKKSHKDALTLTTSFSDDALFTKQYFNWTGTTTLGSYCISAMPSHYEWAIKKLKAHSKMIG
ncbi:MAG: ClbS/DfsB family four-helix bundle protein [Pseudomonadota bacterium]